MDWKNQLTKTPYLVLFIVLISIGVGTASAAITITLAGDVDITGNLDVVGPITGQTITNLQNQINAAGISGETETQIDNIEGNLTSSTFGLEEIKNEVRFIEGNVTSPTFGLEEIKNEVSNIENNTYVPFRNSITPIIFCATQGEFDSDEIHIESQNGKPFIVTSVFLRYAVGAIDNKMELTSLTVDNNLILFDGVDLTGIQTNTNDSVELLGSKNERADGNFAREIASQGSGTPDIKIKLSCNSVGGSVKFEAVSTVSGWKQEGDTISTTFVETP